MLRPLAALGVLLAVAGSAAGDQYARRNGGFFEAAVLAADAQQVRFRLGDGREQVVTATELEPGSHYRALVAHRAPVDAVDRLALARVCLEALLFGPARVEARQAAAMDAELALDAAAVAALTDEVEARDLLTRGLEWLAAGDARGAPLLLDVVNRFAATGALPAAAGALKTWATGAGAAPPAAPGAAQEPPALAALVDGALRRARAHADAGLQAAASRGDQRERAFAAAETELEAARRAVEGWKRAGRAPAARCDARLQELTKAFVTLCAQAGRALIESRRTKAAHRFIYRGLALVPDHVDLLALQAALAAAELDDTDDPSKMTFGELSRRVARGAATEEMRRIWRRRAESRGLDPDAPARAPGLGATGADPLVPEQPRRP